MRKIICLLLFMSVNAFADNLSTQFVVTCNSPACSEWLINDVNCRSGKVIDDSKKEQLEIKFSDEGKNYGLDCAIGYQHKELFVGMFEIVIGKIVCKPGQTCDANSSIPFRMPPTLKIVSQLRKPDYDKGLAAILTITDMEIQPSENK